MDVIVYLFVVVVVVVVVCQSVSCIFRCFAMVIDLLRLVVCWNHIDGVAVWWVSPYEPLDNSLHMAFLTPCVEGIVVGLLQMCMLS